VKVPEKKKSLCILIGLLGRACWFAEPLFEFGVPAFHAVTVKSKEGVAYATPEPIISAPTAQAARVAILRDIVIILR
jgi:hypothetical protein